MNSAYMPSPLFNELDCVSIERIQNELDANIRCLSDGWDASIPFNCCVVDDDHLTNDIPTNFIFSQIDICEYFNGRKYPASRLIFCPNTYVPPSSDHQMRTNSEQCVGWTDLRRALCLAAFESGNPIISNGSQLSNQRGSNNRHELTQPRFHGGEFSFAHYLLLIETMHSLNVGCVHSVV